MIRNLNVADLADAPAHGIFAAGKYHYWYMDRPVSWVAVRGLVNDWAIYKTESVMAPIKIAQEGEKITDTDIIKKLVPCTDEAFRRYRF